MNKSLVYTNIVFSLHPQRDRLFGIGITKTGTYEGTGTADLADFAVVDLGCRLLEHLCTPYHAPAPPTPSSNGRGMPLMDVLLNDLLLLGSVGACLAMGGGGRWRGPLVGAGL